MEAVFYSVPLRQIEEGARAGKKPWIRFKALRARVEEPIAAILSLNTIANTAGAAFAGSAATAVFGYRWLGLFSAAFTLGILLFSEILPKTVGVVYGRRMVPPVAYMLKGLVGFMRPVTWLTGYFTGMIAGERRREVITSSELGAMVRLGLESGTISPHQERSIQRILTLDQRRVKDVMTPRTVVFSLSGRLSIAEARRMQDRWEHSRFPVFDRDPEDIVGLVLTKDLFAEALEPSQEVRLLDIMRPVRFVAETAPLDQVLRDFLDSRQHLFVVSDEYGGLAGIITLEDILEEILGSEIVDESDRVADKRALAKARRGASPASPVGGAG